MLKFHGSNFNCFPSATEKIPAQVSVAANLNIILKMMVVITSSDSLRFNNNAPVNLVASTRNLSSLASFSSIDSLAQAELRRRKTTRH